MHVHASRVLIILAQRVQQQHMRLFSVELAENLTSGRVDVLHMITFAQLDHRHNSLPQPQPQLPAWVHHSCIAACGHVDSCRRALLWLSTASAVEIRDKKYIFRCAASRATIVLSGRADDSRVRERKVVLRLVFGTLGPAPYVLCVNVT